MAHVVELYVPLLALFFKSCFTPYTKVPTFSYLWIFSIQVTHTWLNCMHHFWVIFGHVGWMLRCPHILLRIIFSNSIPIIYMRSPTFFMLKLGSNICSNDSIFVSYRNINTIIDFHFICCRYILLNFASNCLFPPIVMLDNHPPTIMVMIIIIPIIVAFRN